ncbi:MAG TPA: glycosyltransferase [Candidatus Binatia bacterium]|nr:glycosyltransferase [Candidatus Binatia bacterium]
MSPGRLRIAFVRPGLGIGGAERLVVDAALELDARGHEVTLFVGDRQEAQLDEVKAGRVRVVAVGGKLPAHVAQRLRAPAAILRAAWAARALARARPAPDVVVVDLVPHVIPLVRRLVRVPVACYCHFPDLLLAPRRRGLYAIYRAPLDRMEERGLIAADRVLVNSRFTASVVQVTFPRLDAGSLEVIHPGVDVEAALPPPWAGEPLILSVNRFDPGKNLTLAVDALAALRERMPAPGFAAVRLVLAGHFDERLAETRALGAELGARAARLGLEGQVALARSPSDAERRALLARAACVVYTPLAEHFGIVPLEAMAAARPVIAVNRGGPTETIVSGETGWLAAPTPAGFAEALARVLGDAAAARRMGEAGWHHVRAHFSRAAFGARMERALAALARG